MFVALLPLLMLDGSHSKLSKIKKTEQKKKVHTSALVLLNLVVQ